MPRHLEVHQEVLASTKSGGGGGEVFAGATARSEAQRGLGREGESLGAPPAHRTLREQVAAKRSRTRAREKSRTPSPSPGQQRISSRARATPRARTCRSEERR